MKGGEPIEERITMESAEVFKVRDLSLAAAVSMLGGTDPTFEADHRGRMIFVFDGSDEVRRLATAYTDGTATGSLIEYAERLKGLRSKMFLAQDMSGRHEIRSNGAGVGR